MAILARWLMSAGYAVDLAEEGATSGEALANADIALAIIAPEGWRRGAKQTRWTSSAAMFDT
ncbi:MAG TPA: hypothetical protein VKB87_17225 [Myxococcaceae bacterium]|nr:hypothetical protein [Myxococcaceae bacterium]